MASKWLGTISSANHIPFTAFQIPIKIGTLNSKSAQDIVIYVINEYSLGHAAISNYREITYEDECLWESEGKIWLFREQSIQGIFDEDDSAIGWLNMLGVEVDVILVLEHHQMEGFGKFGAQLQLGTLQ